MLRSFHSVRNSIPFTTSDESSHPDHTDFDSHQLPQGALTGGYFTSPTESNTGFSCDGNAHPPFYLASASAGNGFDSGDETSWFNADPVATAGPSNLGYYGVGYAFLIIGVSRIDLMVVFFDPTGEL